MVFGLLGLAVSAVGLLYVGFEFIRVRSTKSVEEKLDKIAEALVMLSFSLGMGMASIGQLFFALL